MIEFPPLPARVIYSPAAGARTAGARRLADVVQSLAAVQIEPDTVEVYSSEAATAAAAEAVGAGLGLIIACGGDGTIESVANAVVGTSATLGILPAGTRNNVARSLGIPMRLPEAVRALRTGRRQAIGAGHAQVGDSERWFLETFTLGLFSAMFPHADAIQKGDLLRVRSLLASFLTAPQSRILIDVDDGDERIELKAHAVLGVNMPLTGANFRLGADIAYDDEHIDIFLYDRLDKLDFLFYGLDVITGVPEDPAIARLRARKAVLRAEPPLPVMADGFALGTGDVTVHMEHAALAVMTPHASSPPAPRPE